MTAPYMPDIFTRLAMADDAKRRGQPAPWLVGDPLIIGVCAKGRRILRVWPDPAGWALLMEGGRRLVSAEKWLERQAPLEDGSRVNVADLRAGRAVAPSLRRVGRAPIMLPHDFADWPALGILCTHGEGHLDEAELARAVDRACRARRPKTRHTFRSIP